MISNTILVVNFGSMARIKSSILLCYDYMYYHTPYICVRFKPMMFSIAMFVSPHLLTTNHKAPSQPVSMTHSISVDLFTAWIRDRRRHQETATSDMLWSIEISTDPHSYLMHWLCYMIYISI